MHYPLEESGAITTSVPAHSQDGEGTIAFNIRYLGDYLAGKLGPVLLETSKPSSPGRFFHSGSPDVLVMPMYVGDPAAPTTGPAADPPAVDGIADEEAPEKPIDGQQAPVEERTTAEPAAAPSPPTRSKKAPPGEVKMQWVCQYPRSYQQAMRALEGMERGYFARWAE